MVYPLHNLISEHKKWLLVELTSKCNYVYGYLVPSPSHTYVHQQIWPHIRPSHRYRHRTGQSDLHQVYCTVYGQYY